jgi:hypothetical protein
VSLDLYRLPHGVRAEIRVLSHLHVVPLLTHDHLVLDGYLALTGSVLLEVREVDGALARIKGVLKR